MVNFEQFLELIDTYREKTGLAESTISVRLFNDGKRIKMLREHDMRDVGIKKVEDAVLYLSENWPVGAAWPKRIARPDMKAEH